MCGSLEWYLDDFFPSRGTSRGFHRGKRRGRTHLRIQRNGGGFGDRGCGGKLPTELGEGSVIVGAFRAAEGPPGCRGGGREEESERRR
ncbi:hypothetical protein BHE74_00048407 [Ensete ventricosum]|nr:hypothetical protein BHE74_00048407 [Ensete ventricosum]